MRTIVMMTMLLSGVAARAEVSCFRTPAQAAVGVGEQEGGGYRLEFVSRDAVGGKTWARVRSCAHPEWPGVVVRGVEQAGESSQIPARRVEVAAKMGHPDVVAGTQVRVVSGDAIVRLEMTGVAQASGRVGERLRVRILAPGGSGEGHVELAVVRSAELLELVEGR